MGKRYGRNKKRRDKAKIEELELSLAEARTQRSQAIASERDSDEKLQIILRRIHEIAPNSTLLKPEVMRRAPYAFYQRRSEDIFAMISEEGFPTEAMPFRDVVRELSAGTVTHWARVDLTEDCNIAFALHAVVPTSRGPQSFHMDYHCTHAAAELGDDSLIEHLTHVFAHDLKEELKKQFPNRNYGARQAQLH